MSIFDAPLARCEDFHTLVMTDETQAECAHEHDCPPGHKCPLVSYFTESSGISEEASIATLKASHQGSQPAH
jgi:hypothetical protein